ncbi:MAG: hypothetical protein KME09_09140 [Pleurocapsa minor HA4230-MV1]|jgi:chromosome segregation ATPase|nr:hypothetical protein [Pleurocapsa minor HA4230-MV1]
MSNQDTKESRINNLKQTQRQRQEDAKNRVYQAIERLHKLHAKINFHTIAREAQVSVSYLYKYPEIKQYIAELRSQQNSLPVSPVAKSNSTSSGKVITRLQEKIKKIEEENKELKRKCEALAGQVYRAHHLQAQIERLQQENEDLRAKLGKQEIAKKVTPIDKKLRSTEKEKSAKKQTAQFDMTEKVQSELEQLRIELNTTLSKTIGTATESTILDAIEALKYQLTKQDIPNAGGWLNKAISEGWTKPEITTQQSTKPEQKIVTVSDKPEKKLVDPNQLKKLSNIFNKKND